MLTSFLALVCPAVLAAPAQRPRSTPVTEAAGSTTSPGSRGNDGASAFEAKPSRRDDPYGPRPPGVPQIDREQIVAFALENPAVKSAEQRVEAMKAQLRKAKFRWLPMVETTALLSPGVNIRCDDVPLVLADGTEHTFQYCRPPRDDSGRVEDVQTVRGYFDQLHRAGVRFELGLEAIFPITTFGKGMALQNMAQIGVALARLGQAQVEAETVLRVHQAHTTLLLAREAIRILHEAKEVAGKARARVVADLGGDPDDFAADPSAGNPERDPDDLFRVDLAEIGLEERMREARKVEALSLSALWALAGDAAPPHFDVREDRLERWGVRGGLAELDLYKIQAARERPEAKMAEAQVELRQAQQKLARRAFLPDLGLVVSAGYAVSNAADRAMRELYYQDRFNYSRVTAALALRWRWDFHNKAFDLQQATAEFRAAEYQRDAARLLLGREVEEAYQDLVEAGHNLAHYQRATDVSWKLVVSQEQRDSVGGGNAKDLMRALQDWYEWRFKLMEALQVHNVALARLSRAVGAPLLAPSPTAPR